MTHWSEFSAADFDATRAPKTARKRAEQDAESGQAGLFFAATPVTRPATAKPDPKRLPDDVALFSDDDTTEGN